MGSLVSEIVFFFSLTDAIYVLLVEVMRPERFLIIVVEVFLFVGLAGFAMVFADRDGYCVLVFGRYAVIFFGAFRVSGCGEGVYGYCFAGL